MEKGGLVFTRNVGVVEVGDCFFVSLMDRFDCEKEDIIRKAYGKHFTDILEYLDAIKQRFAFSPASIWKTLMAIL